MSENKSAKTPADGPEYERGFVDGMQHQMKSSVDKAINKKQWVGLTDEDEIPWDGVDAKSFARAIEAKLKERNT
jgi:hypothetical protein